MDTSKILYKGIVGSQLYGCARDNSDIDYFIVWTEPVLNSHRVETPTVIADYFWVTPHEFIHNLFDNRPADHWQVNVVERLLSKDTGEITSPLQEWLLANRTEIILANRPYFKEIMLWRADLISASEENLFTGSPKTFMKALINLYTYINFAECEEYVFGELTESQQQVVADILANKFTNKEIFNLLKETYVETVNNNYEFWEIPANNEVSSKLRQEMTDIVVSLVGEEPEYV